MIIASLLGGIKETDCKKYPPFGIQKSKTMYNEKGQRLVPKIAGTSTSRAKGGFEYWYKEPKANISGKLSNFLASSSKLSAKLRCRDCLS